MWPYLSEREALTDVNRLSQGMTYKSAVADTGLGGGKAVILGNPKTDKSEALFRAMGKFVEGLKGLYTTAEDVGTSVQDMVIVRKETRHVTGLPREMGSSGDPSARRATRSSSRLMTQSPSMWRCRVRWGQSSGGRTAGRSAH